MAALRASGGFASWPGRQALPSIGTGATIGTMAEQPSTRSGAFRALRDTIHQALDSDLPLAEQAEPILAALCVQLGCEVAVLWQADEAGGVMRCRQTGLLRPGALAEAGARLRHAAIPRGSGLAGRAWQLGQPQWVPDMSEDGVHGPWAPAALMGGLAVPVREEARVLGVVEVLGGRLKRSGAALASSMLGVISRLAPLLDGAVTETATPVRLGLDPVRAIAEHVGDGIIVGATRERRVLMVNRAACELLRCSESEIAYQWAQATHAPGRLARIAAAPAPRGAEHETVPLVRSDGTSVTVALRLVPTDWHGQPAVMVVLGQLAPDAEDRGAVQSDASALVTNLPGMAFLCRNDARWTFEFASPGAMEILGYLPADLVRLEMSLLEQIHPDDRELVQNDVRTAIAKRKPVQLVYRIRGADGLERWVLESRRPLVPPGGEITTLEGFAFDITKQKQAEQEQARLQSAIKKAATEWQLTLDAVELPVLMLTLDGTIQRLNRPANDLLGGAYARNLGRSVFDLGNAEPWQRIGSHLPTHERHQEQLLDPSTGRTWEIILIPIAARETRVIVTVQDQSARVALENAVRRSETMSAMGALVAGVAHEVRNPLFAVTSTIDALEARFGAEGEHARYVRVMRTELDRLSRLMQELLDYGRPAPPTFATGSLAAVIDGAVAHCAPLAEQLGVLLEIHVDREIGPLMMQQERLALVFRNLVENSIQHSEHSHSVTVDASASADGRSVTCTISDRGSGFRSEDLPRLFEPFFTRRKGGTGLGLSIVKRILDEHGGTVSLSNRVGGGAVVTVTLTGTKPERLP